MDDLHYYTRRKNSVREAKEQNSLVFFFFKKILKKTSFAAYKYYSNQTHITKRKKIKPKQDIRIGKNPKIWKYKKPN